MIKVLISITGDSAVIMARLPMAERTYSQEHLGANFVGVWQHAITGMYVKSKQEGQFLADQLVACPGVRSVSIFRDSAKSVSCFARAGAL